MVLDRSRARRAFAEYVRAYDPTDPKVRLKIDHTYRVAALCEQIARSVPLSEEDTDRAWLAGLLPEPERVEPAQLIPRFSWEKVPKTEIVVTAP